MKTPLFGLHQSLGATLVDFAGWSMPLHYGSAIQEHLAVREQAGIFDVSHLGILVVEGEQAQPFLRYALANDVRKLAINQGFYTCLLNEQAGILDDLIVYRLSDTRYYLVVNASTTLKDGIWLQQLAASFQVKISLLPEFGILAIQGPLALEKLKMQLNMARFEVVAINHWIIARTGYTGEDGVEIILPYADMAAFWQKMIAQGVQPVGLAARDSLRLEAGLNLYGQDMDETVTPLECNLAWTVDWHHDFVGKAALEAQKQRGGYQQQIGLVLQEKGVCRKGMLCELENGKVGQLTSGGFSPILNNGLGLARVPFGEYTQAQVLIRDKKIPAKIVKLPFVKARMKS